MIEFGHAPTTNLYPQISQIAQIKIKNEKSIATKSAKATPPNLYPQISQITQIKQRGKTETKSEDLLIHEVTPIRTNGEYSR
jgi:hypothetical protein